MILEILIYVLIYIVTTIAFTIYVGKIIASDEYKRDKENLDIAIADLKEALIKGIRK